jgi:hypothetical protein
MPTPSSGPISWSQIQAQTGGAYSMSNFNAVTGLGYSASNYYNYSPIPPCYVFYVYATGWIDFLTCDGYYYTDFWFEGDEFCARSVSGAAYSIGGCDF